MVYTPIDLEGIEKFISKLAFRLRLAGHDVLAWRIMDEIAIRHGAYLYAFGPGGMCKITCAEEQS